MNNSANIQDLMEVKIKMWDALEFIEHAGFLCKREKGEKAASELQEAINLLKEIPSGDHVGCLLADASSGLQGAIGCIEDGYISEAIHIMDSAASALKMAAKEVSDVLFIYENRR